MRHEGKWNLAQQNSCALNLKMLVFALVAHPITKGRLALDELKPLVDKKILCQKGSGRSVSYVFR